VESVWEKLISAGEMVQMIRVFLLVVREGASSRVNFESRNGM